MNWLVPLTSFQSLPAIVAAAGARAEIRFLEPGAVTSTRPADAIVMSAMGPCEALGLRDRFIESPAIGDNDRCLRGRLAIEVQSKSPSQIIEKSSADPESHPPPRHVVLPSHRFALRV
jgi:hypothetical protein